MAMMESSHKIFSMRLLQPLMKQNKIQRSFSFVNIQQAHVISFVKDIRYNCFMIISQGYSGLNRSMCVWPVKEGGILAQFELC